MAITESEKERLKEMRDSLLDSFLQINGEDVSEENKAKFVGKSMAIFDALFAIREGEAWRGLTDPKEIARSALRQGGQGD